MEQMDENGGENLRGVVFFGAAWPGIFMALDGQCQSFMV